MSPVKETTNKALETKAGYSSDSEGPNELEQWLCPVLGSGRILDEVWGPGAATSGLNDLGPVTNPLWAISSSANVDILASQESK
jgi:hypothetical protein